MIKKNVLMFLHVVVLGFFFIFENAFGKSFENAFGKSFHFAVDIFWNSCYSMPGGKFFIFNFL